MNIMEALSRDPNDGLLVFFGLFKNRADILLILQYKLTLRKPYSRDPKDGLFVTLDGRGTSHVLNMFNQTIQLSKTTLPTFSGSSSNCVLNSGSVDCEYLNLYQVS